MTLRDCSTNDSIAVANLENNARTGHKAQLASVQNISGFSRSQIRSQTRFIFPPLYLVALRSATGRNIHQTQAVPYYLILRLNEGLPVYGSVSYGLELVPYFSPPFWVETILETIKWP